MKILLICTLLCFSTVTSADPHFVQALHPYVGGEGSDGHKYYLTTFNEPISATYGEAGGVFMYIYRFNQKNLSKFTIDVSCRNKEIKFAHNLISDNATITNKKVSWDLDPNKQKQIVRFYTVQDRIDREYYLNDKDSESNKIHGPSCNTMEYTY